MNLLIADDEAVIRRGLLSLDWKSIGITDVYSVANGVEAKELLLSTSIDLVIFDIRMPGFSGLELAQMVKERSMDVAVVLLSGFSEFEYARSAMRYGVYEYLLKPVSPNELMETMHNVMHRLEQKRFEQKLLSQKDEFGEKHDAVSQVNSLFVQSSNTIKSILTDIAQNYEQNISLSDLAEKYHFSESYISRKIKKESVDDFKPIGYMIIECKNSYFSEKLQSVPSTYKNRFYLLNNDMDIIVSSEKNMCGNSFPLETRDFKNVKIVKDPSTGENSYFTYQYVNNGWLLVSTINVGQLWKSIGIALVSVLITFGIVLLVSLIIMRYAARVMVKPTKKLVDSMTAYQEGNFDSRFKVESQDEISQIGMVYNQMADKVQNLIEKNYTLEIANREAEIEFLKMQINPHFLYNCLDTISWLGFSNGNSEITDLAVALGKFLRASIKREDYYTVKQEMEVVDNYLFIQKYRFGDKIEIRHNIPDEVLNFYMPSFIIQPVIENSIVHGLEEQIEKGILWINIQLCDNKYLQFNLTDNGKGMDEEQLKLVIQNYSDKNKKSSIGLSNVYRRLNLLYGEACEFHVTSVAGEGTEVTFRIPVMQVPGNHTLNEI